MRRECRCARRSSGGRMLMISQLGARAGARVCCHFEGRSWRCELQKRCRGSGSTGLPVQMKTHAHSLSRLSGLFLIATSYNIIASMMLGHVSKSASRLDLNDSTCHLECQQHRRCDTSQLPRQWTNYAISTPRLSLRKNKARTTGRCLTCPFFLSLINSPPQRSRHAAPRVYRHRTRPSP